MIPNRPTGYLLIDHSNSPGLSPEFARRFGARCAGEGEVFEADTYTCPHCSGVVLKAPGKTDADRNICRRCGKVTCHQPGCVVDCVPLDKVFDILMERAEKRPEEQITADLAQLRRDILG